MGKKFITDGAKCMCNYGSSVGQLKVTSHSLLNINQQNKKMGTSMDLGLPFYPPYFGICSYRWPSTPCSPNITKWENVYTGMRISQKGNPLLSDSKATCAVAATACVQIVDHGQVEVPGESHIKSATSEFQADLDLTGLLSEEKTVELLATII